jgi:SAM-dependent methyltransferase
LVNSKLTTSGQLGWNHPEELRDPMKTEWDYTGLAVAYVKRPDYADTAIDSMLTLFGVSAGATACDIGAGVGHLTLMLAARGLNVVALEPNDDMRGIGAQRCGSNPSIRFFEAAAEHTHQADAAFDCVTFGSSFNVTDRAATLIETHRILKPGAWFGAMWNHRDLEDPIQGEIEAIIHRGIPGYGYGTRREDQTEVINASGLFGPVEKIEGTVIHTQPVAEAIEAWRSHATLQRQAGASFPAIVDRIAGFLNGLGAEAIEIPYTTRIWAAQKRN